MEPTEENIRLTERAAEYSVEGINTRDLVQCQIDRAAEMYLNEYTEEQFVTEMDDFYGPDWREKLS